MSSSLARPAGGPQLNARKQLDELDALLQRMLDLPVQPGDEAPPAPVVEERQPPRWPREREEPPPTAPPRGYPPSYMVVETNTPELAPGGEEGTEDRSLNEPIPGGRHDLVEGPAPDEPPAREGEWVPFRSSWQPSAQTWAPLARTWQQAQTQARAETPEPGPAVPAPPPVNPFNFSPPLAVEPAAPPAPRLAPPAPVPPAPEPAEPAPGGLLLPLYWFNLAFDACLVPLGPLGRWLRAPSGRAVLGAIGVGSLLAAAALVVGEGIGWTW